MTKQEIADARALAMEMVISTPQSKSWEAAKEFTREAGIRMEKGQMFDAYCMLAASIMLRRRMEPTLTGV